MTSMIRRFSYSGTAATTCLHLHQAGLGNGAYHIDPDGEGSGVDPFAVYCDQSDGSEWRG